MALYNILNCCWKHVTKWIFVGFILIRIDITNDCVASGLSQMLMQEVKNFQIFSTRSPDEQFILDKCIGSL